MTRIQLILFFSFGLTLISANAALTTFGRTTKVQEFVEINNDFTSDLLKKIVRKTEANFLISPFSIESILGLLQSGSKKATGQEIRNCLKLYYSRIQIGLIFKEVSSKLTSQEYELDSANKIYINQDLRVIEDFRNAALDNYKTEFETVNFAQVVPTANKINNWVQKKTADKITNIVAPNQIDTKTIAFLINILYFKGSWSTVFPPVLTKKTDFYKNDGTVVKLESMFLEEGDFLYFECHHLDAKLLELPFKGESASMTIILPNNKNLDNLGNNINRAFGSHNMTPEVVSVLLPKFKIESEHNLVEILKDFGIRKMFNEQEADLSRIAGKKGKLVVSKIIQKTFAEINEQGVEATGGTYIPVITTTMGSTADVKHFFADHPFYFYIKVKGIILFAGRFTGEI